MKTTKDILKEHLGSLNFPDAVWDELAEKIDTEKEREMYLNMQYYYEYVEANGYVTPQDWIEKHKHF